MPAQLRSIHVAWDVGSFPPGIRSLSAFTFRPSLSAPGYSRLTADRRIPSFRRMLTLVDIQRSPRGKDNQTVEAEVSGCRRSLFLFSGEFDVDGYMLDGVRYEMYYHFAHKMPIPIITRLDSLSMLRFYTEPI